MNESIDDDKFGINKTNLLFLIAKYYIKYFKLSKSVEVQNSIENICSYEELKIHVDNLKETDKINLGDTLYSIISKGSELIINDLRNKKIKEREIIVKINPIYINKLIKSNISLSLLPMIDKPNAVGKKGEYLPFNLINTRILALDECKLIKGKYDQRFSSEESEVIRKAVDYINSIKFKINEEMLVFITKE